MIKILLGGSPCTYWSIAKADKRETEASGVGWELFKNYLIAKKKFNPDIFLYENNKSAAPAIKQQIRNELSVYDGTFFMQDTGARYIEIDPALVSAQHRERFYVHNCGDVPLPSDRGIILRDILDYNAAAIHQLPHGYNSGRIKTDKAPTVTASKYEHNNLVLQPIPCGTRQTDKARCLRAAYSHSGQRDFLCDITTNGQLGATGIVERADKNETRPTYQVKNQQIIINGKSYPFKAPDGLYIIRKLSVNECCRLQTMPDNYCRAVSNAQAYKGLGNGWTAEVIIHILQKRLNSFSKDTPLLVLSMYDGIGTGRYCLDKLGFRNVQYHAYEIDKYAMTIANSNYPDIIQHGDAFALRADDWRIES